MTTYDKAFRDGLIAKLKSTRRDWAYTEGCFSMGSHVEVDWDELTRQIDEFCAEMKAKQSMG